MTSITNSGVQIVAPATTPSLTLSTGGALSAGVYTYKVTYVTAYGETLASAASGSVTAVLNDSIDLASIPVSTDGNVIARKLYRTIAGGATYLLAATIANNTATTYNDKLADASLGAAEPTVHLADSLQTVKGNIQFSKPIQVTFTDNITARAGGGQANAVPLTAEVNFITVCATLGDSVLLPQANASWLGLKIVVNNGGAATAYVYPTTGQIINGGAANAAATVAAGATATFVVVSATAWKSY